MTDITRKNLPFKIVSSSVDSEYTRYISNNFKSGIDITNMHRDSYNDATVVSLQSPFTRQFVGGEQVRKINLNTGSDNNFNRPELFKIQATASSLRVYGPDYENVNFPIATYWLGSKSSLNISNVQNTDRIIGNFSKNYQVLQTSGRGIVKNLISDNFIASGSLTTQFIFGANNYSLPDIIRNNGNGNQYKNNTTFVNRFNAPGDKKQSSRGALDRNGEELSPNNSLTTRNITVRQPFYSQLTQHSPQFGSGSTYDLLPSTSIVNTVSLHKVNRNSLRRIEFDGTNYVSSSLYDNYWVQHAIPQDNFGFAWITASAISNPYTLGTSSVQFDFTSSLSTIKDKTINLDTQTINESLKNIDRYYSSWRQLRTNEHPVARKLREANIFAIEDNVVHVDNSIISRRSLKSTNFKEPPVTNKFYPIKQKIRFKGEPEGEYTSLKYSYNNISSKFANESINTRLDLRRSSVPFYQKLVDAKNLDNSPILDIIDLSFRENVFPKAVNTYLSGTRSRTQYILDQAGFDHDGYDRQLGTQRVFWRDDQQNRRRSQNSSGGYINSLGYSSTEESGSVFSNTGSGILYINSWVSVSSSYLQNSNIDKGLNNSILILESSSVDREIFTFSGSYSGYYYLSGNYTEKLYANIIKRGIAQDIGGEFNNIFIDFYEQYADKIIGEDKKVSIGSIYRISSYNSLLNQLSKPKSEIINTINNTENVTLKYNPKLKYVSFTGGGELNTGSLFDNSSNFNNDVQNIYYSGSNGVIYSIVETSSSIYFGGSFTSFGGQQNLYSLAEYNKNTGLISGFPRLYYMNIDTGLRDLNSVGYIKSMIVTGTDLYVAGAFFSDDGINSLNSVAKLDLISKTWSQLGAGLERNAGFADGEVNTLVFSGSDLYAGGRFNSSNAVLISPNIAKWNIVSKTWSSVGTGFDDRVYSLLLSGSSIIAGGQFSVTGTNISRWNGTSWSALGSGLGSSSNPSSTPLVYALALSGNNIIAGGIFNNTGNNVSRWDGSSWNAMGNGLGIDASNFGVVSSLFTSENIVYAGGYFNSSGSLVSSWNGTNWSSVGSGLSSSILGGEGLFASVYTFSKYNNKLLAGGLFTITGSGLSQYDTSQNKWSIFSGTQNINLFNNTLLNSNTNIDNIKFSTLDNGLIRTTEKQILKTGFYDKIENYQQDINKIAKEYSIIPEFKLSDNLDYYISQNTQNFKQKNNAFLSIDGVASSYLSAETEISNLNKEFFEKYSYTDYFDSTQIKQDYSNNLEEKEIKIIVKGIKKLLPYNGFYPQQRTVQIANLYSDYVDNALSGGLFSLSNYNDYSNNIILSSSMFTGNSFDPQYNSLFTQEKFDFLNSIDVKNYNNNYYISTQEITYDQLLIGSTTKAALSGTDIYVVLPTSNYGLFGIVTSSYFARYNTITKQWFNVSDGNLGTSSLGSYPKIYALAVSGNFLYVGGDFGGTGKNNVARYNTSTRVWSNMAGGLNGKVNSLLISGTDVYAGGQFSITGTNVARWNGTTWSALGTGLNSIVNALALSGSSVIAGGYFTSSGSYISRWNGTTWSGLSGGLSDVVATLVVSGNILYAAGFFNDASGAYISQWNGTSWSSLGASGLTSAPSALAISGNNLYVGDYYFLKKWNGSTWIQSTSSLGSPTFFIVSGNDIYAGCGSFPKIYPNKQFTYGFSVFDSTYSHFSEIPSYQTKIYISNLNSYSSFNNIPIFSGTNGYHNAKLVSASNGLNLFTIGFSNNSATNKSLFWSVKSSTANSFTTPQEVVSSIHPNDNFGEYWDYIYEPKSEKLIFAFGSTEAYVGASALAGRVTVVTASILTNTLLNTKYLSFSNKIIVGSGTAINNRFGTGISLISSSNSYQLFMGELFGDQGGFTNRGNIWVSTSTNGSSWSTPISIVRGSVVSSSIGFNNIKAVNFTNNNNSRTYVFFTELNSSNNVSTLNVVSSSINNNWGAVSTDYSRTVLFSENRDYANNPFLDATGSNKNSIAAYSQDNQKITYCFVNSRERFGEFGSAVYIGNSNDGLSWTKQDDLFTDITANTPGCDLVAYSTYITGNSEFPVFFTNISSSIGLNSIKQFINNQYTEYSLSISSSEKAVKQAALEPIMSPGILYNSIKSGIAVDWPCATGSKTSLIPYTTNTIINSYYPQPFIMEEHSGNNVYLSMRGNLRSNIDYRVDFEKLIFPNDIFIIKNQLTSSIIERSYLDALDNSSSLVQFISGCYIYGAYEPYISPSDYTDFNQSGPKTFSIPFVYKKQGAKDNGLYSMAISNFLAETVRFFLKDSLLTAFQSNPDSKWETFEKDKIYYMDIVLSKTPNLVMMEGYSDDKHPVGKNGEKMDGRYFGYPVNKTNKKLWTSGSDSLFTSEEARLIHNDPAYAPYTPPYFEGRAIARVSFTPAITRKYTIDEVFAGLVINDIFPSVEKGADIKSDAYINKMPVDSSIKIKGKIPWLEVTRGQQNSSTTNNNINSWVISTKFETPVLDFSSQQLTPYSSSYLKTSGYGRGMWSGYGEIPTGGKGIYVSLQESYPQEYNSTRSKKQSLLKKVGFTQTEKKVGLIADIKTIKEAVMVIPFIETTNTTGFRTNTSIYNIPNKLTDIEKELTIEFIGVDKKIYDAILLNNTESSILNTVNKMKEYIVPPQLDYVKDKTLDPFVAYIVEFEHKLTQQDLADIWQGVAPKIATVAQLDENSITHENKETEFFHGQGLPDNVRFMTFKIKQKGESNYFKITQDSTDDLNYSFEQKIGRSIDDYSYNWPYDYFSLVEMVKIDVDVKLKKK